MKIINSILLLVGTAFVCNIQGATKTLKSRVDMALSDERMSGKDDTPLSMMPEGKYMGSINLTTLYFFNVFFTKQDQERLPFLCQNGSLIIPQGVNTIVSVKPGEYAVIDIPPTVNYINKGAFKGCNVEKIFVWPETVKQLRRNGANIYDCVSPETAIVVVDGLEIQNEIPELPNPPTEPKPNMISKPDSFSEAIAKQKGKLRKTELKKATQTEKSFQDQLNSQKGKLKKTETQKRDPKEYYISPLHQDIHGFDRSKLKRVEKTDKGDKIEKPNPDIFASNPAVDEASKDPFLNNSNQNPTEVERPKSPFLNDINNFNSKNLNHVDQQDEPSKNSFLNSIESFDKTKLKRAKKIEKPKISDPFAAAFIKKIPVMENNKSDNDDVDSEWDD